MYAKGGIPSGSSRSVIRSANNNTGNTVLKGSPIRLTPSGISLIDVSDESSANAIAGLVKADVANVASCDIINSGVIEDVSISASIGDIIYVSKLGGLTNVKPSIGVNSFDSGDWVIRVGVIAQNNENAALRDLIVNIQVIGEL